MTFTTQILVVLLIGWKKIPTNMKYYQDLGSERHQYGISALITQKSFCKGSSGNLVKRQLFSHANKNVAKTRLQLHSIILRHLPLFSPFLPLQCWKDYKICYFLGQKCHWAGEGVVSYKVSSVSRIIVLGCSLPRIIPHSNSSWQVKLG